MLASRRNTRRGTRVGGMPLLAGLVAGGLAFGVAHAAPASAPSKAPVAATAKAPAAPVAKAPLATVRPGSSNPRSSALTSSASAKVGAKTSAQPATHLEDRVTYEYNALGRRDPFQPMVGGAFVSNDMGGDAPVDVGGIKVVGIVWGTNDKFALVEDARGNSLVLRQGDKVMNGIVADLKRDAVLVNLTVDGQTESVSIPLTRKGDDSNANR